MKVNKDLKRYFPIANLVAKTFGKNCEVVIHDLTHPQNSVVYVVNNHVTGREVGETFNILIKQVLLSKDFDRDITANYKTITKDGREIKSSTAFIRNSKNEVIGAICINYDLEKMKDMKDFLDDFMKVKEETIEDEVEPISSVMDIADDIINKIIGDVNTHNLKRTKKIELIEFMEKKGIFLIKGGVEKVAEKLNISKVTVYSYIDEIRKNKARGNKQ
ncbi:PAS domain-containing protein [Wukongibacter baidiensis]|uniref:helix-turn-helix transcriptional regulator n=1 Tax=Wukongibacter baidiensis TaxID=1723361 RepID=UPI003D7FD7BF